MRSAVKTTTHERASILRDRASLGPAIHPGEMLLEEFLKPLGLKQNLVAQELGISANRLNEIILGKRGITADTALRLQDRFRMPAQFWMHLQADWDLQTALRERQQAGRVRRPARRKTRARTQSRGGDGL
jgi:addiction module HigA family antidote